MPTSRKLRQCETAEHSAGGAGPELLASVAHQRSALTGPASPPTRRQHSPALPLRPPDVSTHALPLRPPDVNTHALPLRPPDVNTHALPLHPPDVSTHRPCLSAHQTSALTGPATVRTDVTEGRIERVGEHSEHLLTPADR